MHPYYVCCWAVASCCSVFALVISNFLWTSLYCILLNVVWDSATSCGCWSWKSGNDHSSDGVGSYVGCARSCKFLGMGLTMRNSKLFWGICIGSTLEISFPPQELNKVETCVAFESLFNVGILVKYVNSFICQMNFFAPVFCYTRNLYFIRIVFRRLTTLCIQMIPRAQLKLVCGGIVYRIQNLY